jgi:hypothetical protein
MRYSARSVGDELGNCASEGSGPARIALPRSDGRLVLEQQITAATTVDASHLPPGVYFCRIADAGGVLLVTKLVISR